MCEVLDVRGASMINIYTTTLGLYYIDELKQMMDTKQVRVVHMSLSLVLKATLIIKIPIKTVRMT